MPDNPWMNETPDFQAVAGEDLTAGEAVCIAAADGLAYLADADDATRRPCIGFVETDTLTGYMAEIKGRGQLCGATGLTQGAPIYLSQTPGAITQVAPVGYVQCVAVATNETELVIRLDACSAWNAY